jgi:formate dehydrogenase subunit gamma
MARGGEQMTSSVTRFSVRQRIEHACIGLLFVVLAVTGLTQEFFPMRWAEWTILTMGGIDRVRWVHRGAGILFTAFVVFHLGSGMWQAISRLSRPAIIPTRKDFLDAILMVRYYLRLSDEQPRFGRFDYRQKWEYWGMVLGSVVMIVTGFMLYFPVLTTRFLPGEVIPAALMAHGREGLLAFLVVITWHLFNAHLSPEAFPFDPSIFTGRISRERMEEEHPLEYEQMLAGSGESPGASASGETADKS